MRERTRILIFLCFWLALPLSVAAESLYELPLCKIIEERDPSAQRTELLEQCDKAEQLITDWLAQAPGQGLSSEEAYERALFYIMPAHWLRLLEIMGEGSGVCGDQVCGANETAESCPDDCQDPGDPTGGGPVGGEGQ